LGSAAESASVASAGSYGSFRVVPERGRGMRKCAMISWLLWVKDILKGTICDILWAWLSTSNRSVTSSLRSFHLNWLMNIGLVDGSELEIGPVDKPKASATRYATVEETLGAFEDTLPQHEAAYRELAK
jgi:hypothetical protein